MSGTVNRPSQSSMEWINVKDRKTGKVTRKKNTAYSGKSGRKTQHTVSTRPNRKTRLERNNPAFYGDFVSGGEPVDFSRYRSVTAAGFQTLARSYDDPKSLSHQNVTDEELTIQWAAATETTAAYWIARYEDDIDGIDDLYEKDRDEILRDNPDLEYALDALHEGQLGNADPEQWSDIILGRKEKIRSELISVVSRR